MAQSLGLRNDSQVGLAPQRSLGVPPCRAEECVSPESADCEAELYSVKGIGVNLGAARLKGRLPLRRLRPWDRESMELA
jgi:hypothetical protein